METNFFNQLTQLNLRGNLVINIRIGDGEKMQVSVILRNPSLKDKAANAICPMVLEGTSAEMNQGFFPALQEPLVKTNIFFLNAIQHQQSLEEVSKKSTQSASKSTADGNKKKYEEKMKKVAELEGKQKYGEAIAQMPSTKEFSEFEKQINAKLQELRSKHGSLSLFGNETTEISNSHSSMSLSEEEFSEEENQQMDEDENLGEELEEDDENN